MCQQSWNFQIYCPQEMELYGTKQTCDTVSVWLMYNTTTELFTCIFIKVAFYNKCKSYMYTDWKRHHHATFSLQVLLTGETVHCVCPVLHILATVLRSVGLYWATCVPQV